MCEHMRERGDMTSSLKVSTWMDRDESYTMAGKLFESGRSFALKR